MTISKYIVDFLKEYENIKIDTNHIQDGADKYGLFKSPTRDREEHLDGSATITEYYQFFAKQAAASDADRKDSDEWLEDLTYWLDDYPVFEDYPLIDGGRNVIDINATGAPTPMQDLNNEILYQISLAITYTRVPQED